MDAPSIIREEIHRVVRGNVLRMQLYELLDRARLQEDGRQRSAEAQDAENRMETHSQRVTMVSVNSKRESVHPYTLFSSCMTSCERGKEDQAVRDIVPGTSNRVEGPVRTKGS